MRLDDPEIADIQPKQSAGAMVNDSPDLMIAMRLLDRLKACGFEFQRVALGEDAPLVGNRVREDWIDLIHIAGFSRDCFAWRKRTSSLILPGDALIKHQTAGGALNVLSEVLSWEPGP